MAVALTLLIKANQWPFDDAEVGVEAKEVLEEAIEKGKQGKPMTPGIEAVAAKKILDSRIQVFYENVSVGLGGSALTVDQRGLNEVLRRLHHKKAEKELVETTAKVLRKSNVILQEARDDARQATIEDAARAQTPEEERERLKEDIEYLAIASMAE